MKKTPVKLGGAFALAMAMLLALILALPVMGNGQLLTGYGGYGPEPGTIIIEKQTDPDGSTQSFDFSASYSSSNFSLADDETHNSGPLTPGIYSVSEINIPDNWDLTDATCSDGSNPSAIDLGAGETVTCTFVNECSTGRTGPNCDICAPGFFGPTCEPCTANCVNGVCNEGIGGDGTCSSCSAGFTGSNCDQCLPGRFGPSCEVCTVNCSGHGICNEGIGDDGTCLCDPGWTGPNCDNCAPGFFGPTCEPCTDSDQDGVCDPEWDRSLLVFTSGCNGNCEEITTTVCNGQDSEVMQGTTTYELYWISSGNPKDGSVIDSGTINPLDPGECQVLTYDPNNNPNGASGVYMFKAYQRPGHPGQGVLWSEECEISVN